MRWRLMHRPMFQRDARGGVMPDLPGVREQGAGLADSLADREVDVVARHDDIDVADPYLQQARVDVEKGGRAETMDDFSGRAIAQVEKQIALRGGLFERHAPL